MAKRALVIEDSWKDVELLKHELKGIQIDEFVCEERGLDGLRRFDDGRYEVVFVNLLLPDVDGVDVIKWIRGKSLDVPIIVITGSEDPRRREQAIAAGADGFFGKGLDETDKQSIRNLLRLRIASYKRGRWSGMSWRTTTFGYIGIVFSAIAVADFGPMTTKVAILLATCCSNVGLLFAHDEKAMEAKKKKA